MGSICTLVFKIRVLPDRYPEVSLNLGLVQNVEDVESLNRFLFDFFTDLRNSASYEYRDKRIPMKQRLKMSFERVKMTKSSDTT